MTPWEREILRDCELLMQSASKLLDKMTAETLPQINQIRECFLHANQAIRVALAA